MSDVSISKERTLEQIIQNLRNLNKEFIESTSRFISAGDGKLHTMDLFAATVNNRAIALLHGFVTLSEANNYICSVPLIRLQLDNALRFFAATLVSDYDEFYLKYLAGAKISDMKDANGKNLSDNYLARNLDKHFSGVYKLYQNSSGHIHLSNRHSFLQTGVGDHELSIGIRIGTYDFFDIDSKIDFAYNMQEVTKIVLVVVEQWRHRKETIHAKTVE